MLTNRIDSSIIDISKRKELVTMKITTKRGDKVRFKDIRSVMYFRLNAKILTSRREKQKSFWELGRLAR